MGKSPLKQIEEFGVRDRRSQGRPRRRETTMVFAGKTSEAS